MSMKSLSMIIATASLAGLTAFFAAKEKEPEASLREKGEENSSSLEAAEAETLSSPQEPEKKQDLSKLSEQALLGAFQQSQQGLRAKPTPWAKSPELDELMEVCREMGRRKKEEAVDFVSQSISKGIVEKGKDLSPNMAEGFAVLNTIIGWMQVDFAAGSSAMIQLVEFRNDNIFMKWKNHFVLVDQDGSFFGLRESAIRTAVEEVAATSGDEVISFIINKPLHHCSKSILIDAYVSGLPPETEWPSLFEKLSKIFATDGEKMEHLIRGSVSRRWGKNDFKSSLEWLVASEAKQNGKIRNSKSVISLLKQQYKTRPKSVNEWLTGQMTQQTWDQQVLFDLIDSLKVKSGHSHRGEGFLIPSPWNIIKDAKIIPLINLVAAEKDRFSLVENFLSRARRKSLESKADFQHLIDSTHLSDSHKKALHKKLILFLSERSRLC